VRSLCQLFIGAWTIHGLVQGLGWPSLASILLKWFPKEKLGKNWGLCTTAGNLGQTLAPLALSSLALLYGWKAAFLVPAAISGGMSVVVWFLLRCGPFSLRHSPLASPSLPSTDGLCTRRPPPSSPPSSRLARLDLGLCRARNSPSDVGLALEAQPREDTPPPQPKEAKLGLWDAFRQHVLPDARIWLLCLGSALCYLVLKGLANWTIAFLLEARHFTKMQAASATTAFEGGGIVGSNAACWLSVPILTPI